MQELTKENARLAGELLKLHSASEKTMHQERDRVSKQFEERLKRFTLLSIRLTFSVSSANLEKTRLAADLQIAETKQKSLRNQIDELQTQLENSEKRYACQVLCFCFFLFAWHGFVHQFQTSFGLTTTRLFA